MSPAFPPYESIRSKLLRFYDEQKRDLPWRELSDPYAIWISEIMLQQTRVATVIPYFKAWMEAFPNIEALAAAEDDTVLSLWSGLGYYSRARNIHKCARLLSEEWEGRMPSQAAELRKLPGIGPYTAGAISSIAFGEREALVDGNVLRVCARLFEIDDDMKRPVGQRQVWEHCRAMVPARRPGDFNQALMELGATVCKPKGAECERCPVRGHCRARRSGRVDELPVLPKRKRAADKPLLESHALVAVRGGKLLLARRPKGGLYGGLWELPQSENRAALAQLTGLELVFEEESPSHEHRQELSHRRLRIHVWPARAKGRARRSTESSYEALQWHSSESLTTLGVSAATTAILDHYARREHL